MKNPRELIVTVDARIVRLHPPTPEQQADDALAESRIRIALNVHARFLETLFATMAGP